MLSKNDIYLALLRGINVGGKNKVNTDSHQDMTVRGPGTIRKVYELMSALSELQGKDMPGDHVG